MTPESEVSLLSTVSLAQAARDFTLVSPGSHSIIQAAHLTCPQPRFVVLRSNSATDIETSNAFSVWTCSRNTNLRLNKWYKETQAPVYLLFSVVGRYYPTHTVVFES